MASINGLLRKALPAIASSFTLGVVGLLGMWSGIPWLFPSLGPTIAIQTGMPELPSARPWNVVAGHFAGLSASFAAVYLTGAASVPSVIEAHALSAPRVAAAVLAVLMSLLLQTALKVRHPPAEATALLVALGALDATPRTALTVACGVAIVTVMGEIFRRALLKCRSKAA